MARPDIEIVGAPNGPSRTRARLGVVAGADRPRAESGAAAGVSRDHEVQELRAVVAGLRARAAKIEDDIHARIVSAVPEPAVDLNPECRVGIREAVAAVLEYALKGLELRQEPSPAVPWAATEQARRAARAGVNLAVVLRRCVAGNRCLGEFVAQEVERIGSRIQASTFQELRCLQEALLEHLAASIEREYLREIERIAGPLDPGRVTLVQRLLAGLPVDAAAAADLDYELETSWHLGMVAVGASTDAVLRNLKIRSGRRLLSVRRGDLTLAWLGGRPIAPADIDSFIGGETAVGVRVAVGEPAQGIGGWRVTHQQAQAAFVVALHNSQVLTHYADCSLMAAALQNNMLLSLLAARYLNPLAGRPGMGARLRKTLIAYIEAECNATSAASALRVGRHTVETRIRMSEQLLGRPLRTCLAELYLALRLDELDSIVLDS